MTNPDSRESEIAALEARLAALRARSDPPRKAQPKPDQKGRGGLIAVGIVGLCLVAAVVSGMTQKVTQSPAAGVSSTPAAPETPSLADSEAYMAKLKVPSWRTSDEPDTLNRGTVHQTCTMSINQVSLGFPYGNVSGRLCIRRGGHFGLGAYVDLDGKGQILCPVSEGCTLHVAFDKAKAVTFSGAGAADYSPEIVFFNGPAALIARLRKAKVTGIELNFYQAGQQTLVFDTSGFDWPGGLKKVADKVRE